MPAMSPSLVGRSPERDDIEVFTFLERGYLVAPQVESLSPLGEVIMLVVHSHQPAQRVVQATLRDENFYAKRAKMAARRGTKIMWREAAAAVPQLFVQAVEGPRSGSLPPSVHHLTVHGGVAEVATRSRSQKRAGAIR